MAESDYTSHPVTGATELKATRPVGEIHRIKWAVLVGMLAIGCIGGFVMTRYPDGYNEQWLGVVLSAMAVVWCHYDLAERGRPMSTAFAIAVFFLSPIVVPVYLLLERGWRYLLGVVAFMLVLGVAIRLGMWLATFAGA
jgi:hypothetical protein